MKEGKKLIFLAHPRSGSSSLYQILQLHHELNILEEPFNEGFVDWSPDGRNYLEKLVDIPALEDVLAEIFTHYNGLKMLNYQLDDDLTTYLFQREDLLFIFLRRRNILQSVVSTMIADQSGLWKKWEMRQSLAEYYQNLKPLDIDEIQRDAMGIDQQLDGIERQLDQRPVETVLKFVYEELYFCPVLERRMQVEAIWAFLGVPTLSDDRIEFYLSPEKVKINSKDIYRLIPNVDVIEATCGNDRTGWLFKS